MQVETIVLTVEDSNPGGLPRLGETFRIQLPRMDEAQEFAVAKVAVERRWVNEEGDDEGYVYSGKVTLEAIYEDDGEAEDGGGDDEEEEEVTAPPRPAPSHVQPGGGE